MRTKGKTASAEDTLRFYYDKIKTIPLLSAQEEKDLSLAVQNGDESARTGLIEANLRLVIKIAQGYTNYDVPLIDLIQEGNIGLIKAAERFDFRRNVRFSTYASWWIKQAITRALVNTRRAIRLPHRKEELVKCIHRTFSYLHQINAREPSHAEIADELCLSVQAVNDAMEISGSVVSLDGETENNETGSILDVYADDSYRPDIALIKNDIKENTISLLEALLEKEKQVLIYRFEFYGHKRSTLKGISQTMGVSVETVRQIEKRAIKKLRAHPMLTELAQVM